MVRRVRIVVVGDGVVGKTCLLWAYVEQEKSPDYVPTISHNHVLTVPVNNEQVTLQLWDTAGQEDLTNIRVLSYTGTDIPLVCYSIADRNSFSNVQGKWLLELKNHIKEPRIILVGTKTDLCSDNATLLQLSQEGKRPIQPSWIYGVFCNASRRREGNLCFCAARCDQTKAQEAMPVNRDVLLPPIPTRVHLECFEFHRFVAFVQSIRR
jgi:small GTP-binding protein